MMLKRSTPESQSKPKSGKATQLARAGAACVAMLAAVTGLATGCLDRKVVPSTPTTSNVFVDQIVQTAVDKIDLLFMIDNSVSMADKQQILADAVPVLLSRLVSPICVAADGLTPSGGNAAADGTCPGGNQPEFAPIGDIHIGIVSSSLGAHGGSVCAAPQPTDDPAITFLDDKGELIGKKRPGVASWNNSGFLAWDPSGTKDAPPGENNAANLNTQFTAMVTATGQHGCGYEASLEAWYRFLVDPEPPANVTKDTTTGSPTNNTTVRGSQLVVNPDGTTGVCNGCDTDLLAQRKAFLRPDSLVAIVMLSDENDCSIQDQGVGWFVGATSHMPKATAPCAANPNDKCCRSCAQNETSPPAGCQPLNQDSVCMGAAAGTYNTWDNQNDSLNLRCYNQKQRFGFDLLYPTARYVNALTAQTIQLQSDGTKSVVNPLFDTQGSGKPPRDQSLIFLAGLVGVPWQDISSADSLASPTALTYMNATDLLANNRWSALLGDAAANPPVPPADPFMVESETPRSGMNPFATMPAASIVGPTDSMNPQANVINGHEQSIPAQDDLEFACTFKLATPKMCMPGDSACDCSAAKDGTTTTLAASNSPLCQPTGGGPVGTTQYYAKAYPGARELTVLRDFGANAIVASICPKNTTTTLDKSADPNYGYNPAVGAIIERLKEALKGKCLPRALQHVTEVDPTTGKKVATAAVECQVIEAAHLMGSCNCNIPGRDPNPPSDDIKKAVYTQLGAAGTCGKPPAPSCDDTNFCLCEIQQETGADLMSCESGGAAPAGYCYVDQDGNPLLKNCPPNQKRLLRFVDAPDGSVKTPAQGATAFIACLGASINDGGT
ncbi:MAG TPA: hypothetical protein VGM44_04200 [Polyangiaceae bacterium]|jgi:hypothetical protein